MNEIEELLSKKRLTESEIEIILDSNPEYIAFLYRWLKYNDFVGESCEALCKFLLDNFTIFDKIPQKLTYAKEDGRSELGWKCSEYRIDSRQGKPITPKKDEVLNKTGEHRRKENYMAMDIFNQGRKNRDIKQPCTIEGLGYILDYEMPIGGTKTLLTIKDGEKYDKYDKNHPYAIYDPCAKDKMFAPGKCDLVAYDNFCFTILELKKKDSKEPLIRAVLEAYTYLKMLNTTLAGESLRKYYDELSIPSYGTKWTAAPLLYEGMNQYKEYQNESSYLRKLMEKLEIVPTWYSIENDVYTISQN